MCLCELYAFHVFESEGYECNRRVMVCKGVCVDGFCVQDGCAGMCISMRILWGAQLRFFSFPHHIHDDITSS